MNIQDTDTTTNADMEQVSTPPSHESNSDLRKYVSKELLNGGNSSRQFYAIEKFDESMCSTQSRKMSPSQKFTADDLASNHDDNSESGSIASSLSNSSNDLHSSQFNLGTSQASVRDDLDIKEFDAFNQQKLGNEKILIEYNLVSVGELSKPNEENMQCVEVVSLSDTSKIRKIIDSNNEHTFAHLSTSAHPNSPAVVLNKLTEPSTPIVTEKIIEVPVPVIINNSLETITYTHLILIATGALIVGFIGGRNTGK